MFSEIGRRAVEASGGHSSRTSEDAKGVGSARAQAIPIAEVFRAYQFPAKRSVAVSSSWRMPGSAKA